MAAEGLAVPIVVAIDHGSRNERNCEYSPWCFCDAIQITGGAGEQYLEFITGTLKPFIDSAYRTLPDRENTCIMGSTMGGLISFYGAISKPEIFGKAGIFSPSYWVSDSVWSFLRNAEKVHPMRLYQMVGSTEQEEGRDSYSMIDNVVWMHAIMGNSGFSEEEIRMKIVEGGERDHLLREEFREAYLWLFPEATSSVRRESLPADLAVYPNPASHTLNIDRRLPAAGLRIRIFNLLGAEVKAENSPLDHQINIESLPRGLYLLKITGNGISYSGRFVRE
jgi:alpha-glucosidase